MGNGFGLTETSSLTSFLPHEEAAEHADSVGFAMPVVDVAVDEPDAETGVGELLVRGPNVVAGYWNKPEATAETFVDGWLHTGDLARIDDDGLLYIVDRKKDMINRGGENVYSIEVENALAGAPGVGEAAVVAVPDEMMGEKVGAVIVPAAGRRAGRPRGHRPLPRAPRGLQGSAVRGAARRAAAAQPGRQAAEGAAARGDELGQAPALDRARGEPMADVRRCRARRRGGAGAGARARACPLPRRGGGGGVARALRRAARAGRGAAGGAAPPRRSGVRTIVDPTAMFGGRDVRFMKRVADETGVRIVACTGIYSYDYLPHYFENRDIDTMADHFVEDIERGLPGHRHQGGVPEVRRRRGGVTENVEKIHRACARASLQTGASIMAHSMPAVATGPRQVEIFEEEGVDLARVQIAHCGDTDDVDYIEGLIDSGVYVGLDRYGLEMYLPIEQRNATAAELLRRGHAERLMISQDFCATIDWFPPEAAEMFEASGAIRNWSMTLVFDEVVPALREQGVLDDAVFNDDLRREPAPLADRLSPSAPWSAGARSSSGPSVASPGLLTAGLAARADSRSVGSAPHRASASSAPSGGSSHARWASRSARITGIRSWMPRRRGWAPSRR